MEVDSVFYLIVDMIVFINGEKSVLRRPSNAVRSDPTKVSHDYEMPLLEVFEFPANPSNTSNFESSVGVDRRFNL